MVTINLFGATGYAGAAIAREAVARGHVVTSWTRQPPAGRADSVEGVAYRVGSILDPEVRDLATTAAAVVAVAVAPRGDMAGRVRPAIAELAESAKIAGVRLAVVGGASGLHTVPGGPLVLDSTPAEFQDEAREFMGVLDDLKASDPTLDWFYLSPPAGFGSYAPGPALGRYRTADDVLVVDEAGNSFISAPDLATAFVDEIERPAHHRARFTVGY